MISLFITALNQILYRVDTKNLMNNKLKIEGSKLKIIDKYYDLSIYDRLYIIATGKASISMIQFAFSLLSNFSVLGLAITKYGHGLKSEKFDVLESGHPIPDKNSLLASEKIISLLKNTTENDLIIFLISGGTSSLVEKLKPSYNLNFLISLNKKLLNQALSIREINKIRADISEIKYGGLLKYIYPSDFVTLILSDIFGNDIKNIGSGITYSDKYKSKHFILGSHKDLLDSASEVFSNLNFTIKVFEKPLEMIIDEAVEFLFKIIIEYSNYLNLTNCLIFSSELKINVKGSGKGGRNMELVLRILNKLISEKYNYGFLFASIGSDGTDGPTDAAGAVITELSLINRNKDEIEEYLKNNDSYNYFNNYNELIFTGPTGTNLNDLIVILLKK